MHSASNSIMKCAAAIAILLLLTLSTLPHVHCRSSSEWKSRVIYQLLTDRFATSSGSSSQCSDIHTYCGGTFDGITNKLDYIEGLGVNAIWISPIPVNTDGGYHGYWQQDITKVNPKFGSSDSLKNLVSECHKRDIWVMLDVVGNHVGPQSNGDRYNFDKYTPFNNRDHYHDYCLIHNFQNQTEVEYCRLAGLPDLNQNNDFVRSTLKNWISSTIETYQFDAIRVDTTPEVHPDFWSEYTRSAGVYSIGEVFNGDPVYCCGYQGPLDAVLNYPMYYKLRDAFQNRKSMRSIHNGVTANKGAFRDTSVLGGFLDNHDNPRFLSQNSDQTVLKNALAYNLFAEGIPILYYGTEQGFNGGGDPYNRETLWPHYDTSGSLYQIIATMLKFRSRVGSSLYEAQQVERYVDDSFFAFTRGNAFIATTNIGNGQSLTRTITYHPYSDGTKLINQLDTSDSITVDDKKFLVTLSNGLPKIYYPAGNQGEGPVGQRKLEPTTNSTSVSSQNYDQQIL